MVAESQEKNEKEFDLEQYYEDCRGNGQIEFITFHPSYSYEDFIEGVAPDLETEDGTLNYKLKEGLFKKMCRRALESVMVEKENDGIYDVFAIYLGKRYDAKYDSKNDKIIFEGERLTRNEAALAIIQKVKPSRTTQNALEFWKINTEKGEVFLADFKSTDLDIFSRYESMTKEARKELFENLNESKRFVLIIDEINRGNIPKIFGELITLIEEDKRLGGDNELIVTLPYSRKRFGIPKNLYIIGTMNTADKSISLIDVALRRRFVFEEMAPDIEMVRAIESTDLLASATIKNTADALEKLNKKILAEDELGKDKQIGHAYFIKAKSNLDIENAWNRKVFPLLEEYLYYDPKKLHEWLGSFYDEYGVRNKSKASSEGVLTDLNARSG